MNLDVDEDDEDAADDEDDGGGYGNWRMEGRGLKDRKGPDLSHLLEYQSWNYIKVPQKIKFSFAETGRGRGDAPFYFLSFFDRNGARYPNK